MTRKSLFLQEMKNGLGIIQGWQKIGRHIGRSGRTARRWVDNYGMPIRQAITGWPFAFIHELDLWMFKVDDVLKKEHSEDRKKLREHASMMRNCKKKKDNA